MRWKPLAVIAVCLVILVVSVMYGIWSLPGDDTDAGDDIQEPEYIPEHRVKELIRHNIRTLEVQDWFRDGDTLSRALNRYQVPPVEIHSIAQALQPVQSVNRIRSGTPYRLRFLKEPRTLEELQLRIAKSAEIRVRRSGELSWAATLEELECSTETRETSGAITVSLWESAMAAEMPPPVVLDLADLFGWQIDFATDIRTGDWFQVFFEMNTYPGEETEPGQIIAARFMNNGSLFHAFRFEYPGSESDYYDEEGNSVRRSFLKSPLRYRYISSHFSRSRFHPILKIYRPHLGVDYAAPRGTPVSALGDGIVGYCGIKGGYGKYIEIKHGDAYVTCYGHLSGYGKGISRGVRVKQGQVIGYVGSTGLSTGPHLDFRVRYRGNFINPTNMESPPTEPVPESYRETYRELTAEWMAKFGQEE